MSMIKNMDKAQVMVLKEQVSYQAGQVVSKTLAQNDALSVTLFAFDKDEEISTHESGGDAFVTCLDGVGKITIEISPVLRDLITVIFCYQILRKSLKTLDLSQVSFPLLFPLCYIFPYKFTNSDKGKYKGKKNL